MFLVLCPGTGTSYLSSIQVVSASSPSCRSLITSHSRNSQDFLATLPDGFTLVAVEALGSSVEADLDLDIKTRELPGVLYGPMEYK